MTTEHPFALTRRFSHVHSSVRVLSHLLLPRMSTVFHVTVHVAPRDVARFLQAAEPTIERMKRESELMYFEMYQVHDSPGTITWIEKW